MSDPAFLPDACDANRGGQLSAEQRRELEAAATRNNGRVLGLALRRIDPLARDLKTARVDSIEGAVTKRMGTDPMYGIASVLANTQRGVEPTSYRIRVANRALGNQEFRSDGDLYEFAPQAGMVRLFYLPRSRWAVNLECLPDVPVDASAKGVSEAVDRATGAWQAHDKVGMAEAQAEIAAVDHKMQAYFPRDASLAITPSEPSALAEALVGSWSNPFLNVTFCQDGKLDARLPDGSDHRGQWSVDPNGQLRADLMGAPQVADASVDGAWLTLIIQGQSVRLQRTSAST